MTIEDALRNAAPVISLRSVAQHAGIPYTRARYVSNTRTAKFTPEEEQAITSALRKHGITLIRIPEPGEQPYAPLVDWAEIEQRFGIVGAKNNAETQTVSEHLK